MYDIPIYIQQDATLHSLFISGKCSTCFGWYLHPSSGAHTTVSTESGICQVIQQDATLHSLFISGNCFTCFGWYLHPKHVEQFPDINKLCNVASCWIYSGIFLRCTDPWTLNVWNISRNGYRSQLTSNLEKVQREKDHKVLKFSNGSEEDVDWDDILILCVVPVCFAGTSTMLYFNSIWDRNKMSVRIQTCHLVRKYLTRTY